MGQYDDYQVEGTDDEIGADDGDFETVASATGQDFAATLGLQKTFEIKPQRPMSPDRLVLTATHAPAVNVVSIMIRGTNILGSAASIPGDVFRPDSTVRLRTPVIVDANEIITVTLENNSATALTGVKPVIAGKARSVQSSPTAPRRRR
jgi:hypothetical protein